MYVMAAEVEVVGGKVLVKVEVKDVSGEQVGAMQGFSDVDKGKCGTGGKGKGKQMK